MSDQTSQHCNLQPSTKPPVFTTCPKQGPNANNDSDNDKQEEEKETSSSNKYTMIKQQQQQQHLMCPVIHIIYTQNQTKCTLPTSKAAVCSHIFQNLWLPTYIHETQAYLGSYTHIPKAEYSTCSLHVCWQQWHMSAIDNQPDSPTQVGYILFGLCRLATETWTC
jgi:hypothetical protein